MQRASLIVNVKQSGTGPGEVVMIGYTCQSVHVNFDGTVTFFCSGSPITVPQDRVESISYYPNGAEFCAYCDQSIAQFSRG